VFKSRFYIGAPFALVFVDKHWREQVSVKLNLKLVFIAQKRHYLPHRTVYVV